MSATLHRAVDALAALPGIHHWRQQRYNAAFDAGHHVGGFRGVFATAAQAAASAPPAKATGYDQPEAAAMYRDRIGRLYPSDYPAMLWLRRAMDDGARRVLDLGGHVGIAFHSYQKAMPYPEGLDWLVCDVPAVARAGTELAEVMRRPAGTHLAFTSNWNEADGRDLLFSAGCLQYLEETLGQRLAALTRRPRWLVVNLLPLHDSQAYWTLQHIGAACCAYRIQRRAAFFDELQALGYQVLDTWDNLEKRCDVAFRPDLSLDHYVGAALRLA